MGLGRAQDVEAIAIGHAQVRDDEVEDVLGQPLRRRGDTIRLEDAMTALAKEQRKGGAGGRLVVNDQQVRHGQAASSGNSRVTRVPRPTSESISMRPPCAATMRSAMVSPRPLPCCLPE